MTMQQDPFATGGQNNTAMVNPGRYGDNAMAGSRTARTTRNTGRYGDNAMTGEAITEESDAAKLDMLQGLLNDAGVSDGEIRADLRLSQHGQAKLASQLHVPRRKIPELIAALVAKLDHEATDLRSLSEDARYSFEKDFLGNVTVRDADTGNSEFFHGKDSTGLLAAIKHSPMDEQDILRQYLRDTQAAEPLDENSDGTDEPTDDFDLGKGTFNFPWAIGRHHGTATAEFSGSGEAMQVVVIDARNSDGKGIGLPDKLADELRRQAIAFIPEA